MEYVEIKEQIKQKLSTPVDFNDSDNLLELGLSSLIIMRLVNQWRKQGIKVSFGTLMEHPTFGEWWEIIQKSTKKKKGVKKKSVINKNMYREFALTDVQYAYWVGRDDNQILGGVGCHAYLEFDGTGVDPIRLEKAWNTLQYHHPMLRARFLENGTQKINEKPYCETITVNDFSALSDEEADENAVKVRERLSHRKLKIEDGQVAGVELTILPNGKTRVHVDVDLLIADVQSLQILLRDLKTAYNGDKLSKDSKEWNFASYLANQEIDDKEDIKKSKTYWENRLLNLPKGPELPLAKRPEEVSKTIFDRKIIRINKEEWDCLQNRAKAYKTTPAMLLLAAYAAVLERWSVNKKFLINIPFFNRKTEYKGLEDVIADFTTLILLEINCEENPTFLELLNRIQNQLHEDMKYTSYSGVQVQRELTKIYGNSSAIAPIVFACNLGTPLIDGEFEENLGSFSYMISQTPQVWNDFQSYEDENGVQLTWDSVDELFPKGMVQDMLRSFEKLLHELAEKDWNQRFDFIPEDRKKSIEESVALKEPESVNCLHTGILESAEKYPDWIALEDRSTEQKITYKQLKEKAMRIAKNIVDQNIVHRPIAITLPRGAEQIEAALGILLSANIYVTVSYDQPKERKKLIFDKTDVKYVLTNKAMRTEIDWPDGIEFLIYDDMEDDLSNELPDVKPMDSAYIIMTSGSTGIPKGVEIMHGSAWNTIHDINEKFKISHSDTALAISAMDFDLSVYDIFGILGTGGTLVLLPEEEKKNADYWLEQVKKYHITIWNSVPVLLDMLLIRADADAEKLPLRAVMLSGDWIGLDLPERVAKWTDSCEFIAMGGATEASIWSNYNIVSLPIPEYWKSIPYGKPLKNQSYRVIDEFGRDCPYWVAGELWIGGYGVAKGYRGDEELTKQKFVVDHGQRWYRTGDLGRIWQNGTIEFLGRKDHQVKIRGHRIELGEIEHAIQGFPGVGHVVVDTIADGNGNKTLVAYVGAPLKEKSEITKYRTERSIPVERWQFIKNSLQKKTTMNREKEYQRFLEYSNKRSNQIIVKTLTELGFIHSGKIENFEEALKKSDIADSQKNTVKRWMNIICETQNLDTIISQKDCEKESEPLTEIEQCVEDYFTMLQPHLVKILMNEEEPLNLFYERLPELAPTRLLHKIPGNEENIEKLLELLKITVSGYEGRPLRFIEIASRDSDITDRVIETLKTENIMYTYADTSKYFLNDAKKRYAELENIEYKELNLENDLGSQNVELHSYDVILAPNSLHRNRNVENAVKNIEELLSPGGILIMTDLVAQTNMQDLTAAFLENGFMDIQDERRDLGLVVPNNMLWKKYFRKLGLTDHVVLKEECGRIILCCCQKEKVLVYNTERLENYLREKLPEYMIPHNYHLMDTLPSTSNGKIDRKALKKVFSEQSAAKDMQPLTETEEKLMSIWKELFGIENISKEDNYFTLGGDSLLATRLISNVQKTFGCRISIRTIFENLTIQTLAKEIEHAEKAENLLTIVPDRENAYKEFPLTDVQYAYWIGRSGLYDLGNVATHCYFELDAEDLDISKAEWAWNMLIERHGMMRVLIQPDGRQRILEKVPKYCIKVTDLKESSEENKNKKLDDKREEMSHQIIQTDKWPLYDVQITEISDREQRIHISFDNIIFDGWSMFHILNEWAEIYRTGHVEPSIELSFRDYVIGLESIKMSEVYKKDKSYWENRIEAFSAAPELPMMKTEKQIEKQRFSRRSNWLLPEEWKKIKNISEHIGVTPAVVLMTAYAETLRLWSSNKSFTLNLTQFDRKPLHPEVNQLVGDFTTLTLLEVCDQHESSFAERAKALQNQLAKDLEHTSYSAIEFERQIKKKNGNMQGAVMPIVFTSGLGIEQWNEGKWLGRLDYNISQTPQVWLDHQVVEMDGKLCLFWDSLDELFYPGMLDEMFETYVELLRHIAKAPESVDEKNSTLVRAKISKERDVANRTEKVFENRTLTDIFLDAEEKFADKTAVVSIDRRMTYREIREEAMYIAETLKAEGVKKGDIVAICMEKGWRQIVAVYGVLFAGAAYLPIDIHNPYERIEKILKDSKTTFLLVKNKEEWMIPWKCIQVLGEKSKNNFIPEVNTPDDLAYIIYTSGTTGMPKGVMITHHNAVNTIFDINAKYQVTEKDAVFGISDLHFDLSVYDIFGLLSVGGMLVIPDPKRSKDPAYWIELLNKEPITIWNSVPAFVEMLVEYEEYQKKLEAHTLRLILMSGDWIPTSLPDRIRKVFGNIQMIALGGATEASIWSNYFDIPDDIPSSWKSIPYGKPLANQRYYVLDENGNHCPDWVPGIIYIAGDGVAKGYLNDLIKTKEKFINMPKYNEYLYCTGDMGRYWTDGNIEFLGRIDHQVKINGYRVELGEIESIINKYENIKASHTIFIDKNYATMLIAYYTAEKDIDDNGLLDYLKDNLPAYMVPNKLKRLETFPKNRNGKIDFAQLIEQEIADIKGSGQEQFERTLTAEETHMKEIWRSVLDNADIHIEANFFANGGDSLKAIRLMNAINSEFNVDLTIYDLFKHMTIEDITEYVLQCDKKVEDADLDEGVL